MAVSVIVLVYNAEKTLQRCLDAVLSQTYKDFELVIVDDCSTDNSKNIINSFQDKRIKAVYNEKNLCIAKSRNVGIKNSKGNLIFFTDSDCIPTLTWLESGVNNIKDYDIITGWTLYENSSPSFRDRAMQGKDCFFTCNLGFKRSALEAVNGFDEEFAMYGEDKDLCCRILAKGGKKTFCSNMLVIHQTIFRTPKDELRRYNSYFYGKLLSQIRHHREEDIRFRIIRPDLLLNLIFPPLLLITKPFRSFEDLRLLPFTWLGLARGRLHLWKSCIKQRKFYL